MKYVDLNGVNLFQMQMCVTIAKYKSITKAAAALHISQPALSKKIAQLEEHLGIILFIRGKNTSLRPTPAGQFLFADWSKLINRFMSSYDKATTIQECKSEHLIIATTPSAATKVFISPLVEEFSCNYPDIEIRVEYCTIKDAKERLISGLVDVVLANLFLQDLFEEDRISRQTVLSCPWSVGMRKNNPLAQRSKLQLEDLKSQYFVLPQSDLFIQIIMELCQAHGFTPTVSHYSNYFFGISMCLSGNDEVFITDRFLQDYYNADCAYVDLPIMKSGVLMAVRKQETNAYVEAFKNTTLKMFKSNMHVPEV